MAHSSEPSGAAEPRVLPYRTAAPADDPLRGVGFVWLVASWAACGAAVLVVVGGFAWVVWEAKVNLRDERAGIVYGLVVMLSALASGVGLLIALATAAAGDPVGRRHYRRAVVPWLFSLLATAGPIGVVLLWERLR